MVEPLPKRLRVFASSPSEACAECEEHHEFEEATEASEFLNNDAESDISSQATFGEAAEFEIVDHVSSDENEYEYISTPEHSDPEDNDPEHYDPEHNDMVSQQWWAAGPPGEFQFLLLIDFELELELGNFGLTSGEQLPFGWLLDEGPLRELAANNERGD